MKCFEVVQNVLDATYAEIPGDERSRDALITQTLAAMSDQYRNRLVAQGGPDFSDPVTRFAYVFLYVPAHAHWLHELATWSSDVDTLFDSSQLRMTCLGGGPGSDLVGALKYMAEKGKTPSLFCEIVDGCRQWKQTWSDLAFTLGWEGTLHTDYVIHDVADQATWSDPAKFNKADIFTLSFFASEIHHLGTSAENYLRFALGQAKPGALVLVNDNQDTRVFGRVDSILASLGFVALLASQGDRRIYDPAERRSALGKYATKFNNNPKLTGKLFWRVFRKEVV